MILTDGLALETFPHKVALEKLVNALNGVSEGTEVKTSLRQLLQEWSKSERNTKSLFTRVPVLGDVSIQCYLRGLDSSEVEMVYTFHTGLEGPEAVAVGLFLNFLLNSENRHLGGPCPECGEYFIKQSERRDRKYCKQRCANRVSSRLANKNSRKNDKAEKLKIVMKSVKDWQRSSSKSNWRDWVSKETGTSMNWITRTLGRKKNFSKSKSSTK